MPVVIMRPCWLCWLLLVVAATSAVAHQPVMTLWVEGDAIVGEVGFANDSAARAGIRVEVVAGGEPVGEVVTGTDGRFSYVPLRAVAHEFRAHLGFGHIATAGLERDDLPYATIEVEPLADEESAVVAPTSRPESAALETTECIPGDGLRALIAQAVQREIIPLRKELTAYRQRHDLQDILGGIGYICGIVGLGFFIACKRGGRAG